MGVGTPAPEDHQVLPGFVATAPAAGSSSSPACFKSLKSRFHSLTLVAELVDVVVMAVDVRLDGFDLRPCAFLEISDGGLDLLLLMVLELLTLFV